MIPQEALKIHTWSDMGGTNCQTPSKEAEAEFRGLFLASFLERAEHWNQKSSWWQLRREKFQPAQITLASSTSIASEVEALVTTLAELIVRSRLEFLVKISRVAFITCPSISGLILSNTSKLAFNLDTDAHAPEQIIWTNSIWFKQFLKPYILPSVSIGSEWSALKSTKKVFWFPF